MRITLQSRAYFYLIIATLSWGGNTMFGKMAISHVSPMMLSFWRWVLALVLITAISVPSLIRDWPEIRKNWLLLFAYGAFGYCGFNVLLYSALQYTSAINAAIEQAGIPMLIFLINYLLFRMKVSLAQIVGFGLTLVGIAVTTSHGSFETLLELTLNFGDVLVLACVVVYALYTVSLRWKPPIDWRCLMAVPALAALLTTVPLVLWEVQTDRAIWPDETGWLAIAYVGIFPSLFSQILFIKGVEKIGPNRAGLFINLIPVFGTLLSVMVLGEQLQMFHIVAIMLVLGGIAIAEKGRPKA